MQGITIETVRDLKEWQAHHLLPAGGLDALQPVTMYATKPCESEAAAFNINIAEGNAVAVISKEMLEGLAKYIDALQAAGFTHGIGFDVDGKHKLAVNHWVLLSGGSRRLRISPTHHNWVQTFTAFVFGIFPVEEEPSILYLLLALKVCCASPCSAAPACRMAASCKCFTC